MIVTDALRLPWAAFTAHANEMLRVALIALVTLFCARIGTRFVPVFLPSASLIKSVIRVSILTVGALVALGALGISVAPVLTALGVGGLAVALALRDTLANLFAGLQILASGQIRSGDYVRFDGGEGYIIDITWRNTAVRDLSGAYVIVPNEKLAAMVVVNASQGGKIRLAVPFARAATDDVAVALLAARRSLAAIRPGTSDVRVQARTEAALTLLAIVAVEPNEDAAAVRAAVLEALAAGLA